MSDTFKREEIDYNEGDLVEVILTGERFIFGRAEYSCNWSYTVWCARGNHMGTFNAGYLKLVSKNDPNQELIAKQAADIKMLRDALTLCVHDLNVYYDEFEYPKSANYRDGVVDGEKALAATNQDKE
jgi:hypothetical protein